MQASELRYVFSPLAIVADCYDKFFEGCVPKSSNFACKEFGWLNSEVIGSSSIIETLHTQHDHPIQWMGVVQNQAHD